MNMKNTMAGILANATVAGELAEVAEVIFLKSCNELLYFFNIHLIRNLIYFHSEPLAWGLTGHCCWSSWTGNLPHS